MANPFARQVVAAASRASDRLAWAGGSQTMRASAGKESLLIAPGMGGTLPLFLFTDVAGKPAVVVPIANHDNNQHGANENLRIQNLWDGIETMAAIVTMP